MSFPVVVWVFQHSEETKGRRLTLLALAEFAHDDGSKAFPSIATLMQRTKLSRRGVQDALRGLEAAGAIACTGTTSSGTNVYRILGIEGGAESAPPRAASGTQGAQITTPGGADSAPDPVRTPNHDPAPPAEPASRDEVWDELERRFGKVAPRTNAHAKRNKAVADLKRAGATAATIAEAARNWPRTFSATLTDVALATHFPQLVHRRSTPEPPSVDEVVDLPELSEAERADNARRMAELAEGIGRRVA